LKKKMRYVILRDDDTNALTPVASLERLFRPFLARGLPVNLAVIPEVRTGVRRSDGAVEGFLTAGHPSSAPTVPLSRSPELIDYLLDNPLYHVAQHGCYHDHFEFDRLDAGEASRRLDEGARQLEAAGLPPPRAFVAPYDRLSRPSLKAVAERFDVLSTGWFELGRQPRTWLPQYFAKKLGSRPHWKIGHTALLSHPGCLLSYTRPLDCMMANVRRAVESQTLTVLVTHWWEYYRTGVADEPLIEVLHQMAEYLAGVPDLRVITFGELADEKIPLG
jgi:hypothetical protein